MRRARLLPLVFGLILGFSAGLYYSWVVNPVEYVDASPASLRADYKQMTLNVIAGAFASNGDLQRAQARLALLNIEDPASTLSRLAQNMLAAGQDEGSARDIARLAAEVGERPAAALISPSPASDSTSATSVPATASPTASATLRPTVPPTRTPTATPGAPFKLTVQEQVCDPALDEPQIQVVVLDSAEEGIPGVEIQVYWDDGEDRFFTGLKPELGWGFADFTMQIGKTYSLRLRQDGELIPDLISELCETAGGVEYPGSIRLTFVQPDSS